jgi:hypothetical protein
MTEIKEFTLPDGKIIQLIYIQNKNNKFVARSPHIPLGKIKIDELFFEFLYEEQVAIIYHELWHFNNNLKYEIKMLIKKPWLLFYEKPIYYTQEFNADLNALEKTNKTDTLSMLIRLKNMIIKGILPLSHEKTHPPIDERIKKIEEHP